MTDRSVVSHSPAAGEAAAKPAGRAEAPRSVIRVIQILELLATSAKGYTLTALSDKMQVPKSSLLNLLRGLVEANYVQSEKGIYSLGGESYRLATTIAGRRQFLQIARPFMQALTEQSGETSLMAVLTPDKLGIVYADKVESQSMFRFAAPVGEPRPVFCTAAGRAIMAFQDEGWLDDYFRRAQLIAYNDRTVTDKRALRQILAEIRAQGCAATFGEMDAAVAGFAAPVRDEAGTVIASLVLACQIERVTQRKKQLAKLVLEAAQRISQTLGYR